jgi:TIR domain
MPDLFISYSSHDRRWAERLYNDLRARFPTITIFWDRAPGVIPPGANWRQVLTDNARNTTHFAVLWSKAAKDSNEVGPEIEAFRQNVAINPKGKNGARREIFYMPLQQNEAYGPLEAIQGLADLRQYGSYAPNADDRGVSNLETEPHRGEWNRIVGVIGDTVLAAEAMQPIKLALLVLTEANVNRLDALIDDKVPGGPTLRDFLTAIGLTLDQVKQRYGPNAFSWRPFGTDRTIIQLMEDVRESANRNLAPEYWFHWVPCDFFQQAMEAKDHTAFQNLADGLAKAPSAVVTDPVSLFHPSVAKVFGRLDKYATKEHSVILSISPVEMLAVDRLYQCLLSNGSPVLDTYLLPRIPASGSFARCGVNVQHVADVERLVRGSLGLYHLQLKEAAEKALRSAGG